MSDVVSSKIVKTRKDHCCFGCGRKFPAWTFMQKDFVVDYRDAFTTYLCETCQKICKNTWRDEFGYGDLREEALEMEKNEMKDK